MVNSDSDPSQKELKVAAGIHYGEVAVITENTEINRIYRKTIVEILGYSINYAKRIESSARIGKLSQVFLSLESVELLSGTPIVFYRHFASLKGIDANEIVYEVQSAFLNNLPIDVPSGSSFLNNETLLSYFAEYNSYTDFLRESWLKSFILSVHHSSYNRILGHSQKQIYSEKISKLIWQKQNEDDPILLYFRARECEESQKYTRAINYYKRIIEKFPDFIFARIKLVKDFYEILKTSQQISAEEIFVKDTAEELLDKFSSFLRKKEIDELKTILDRINEKNQNSANQKNY